MDAEFQQHLTEESIVIVTDDDLIEGEIYYHKKVRLSDNLKSPSALENPYLALTNATVTDRATGQQVLHSRFLLVARSKVTALMPKSEVITLGDQAVDSEHNTATAAT